MQKDATTTTTEPAEHVFDFLELTYLILTVLALAVAIVAWVLKSTQVCDALLGMTLAAAAAYAIVTRNRFSGTVINGALAFFAGVTLGVLPLLPADSPASPYLRVFAITSTGAILYIGKMWPRPIMILEDSEVFKAQVHVQKVLAKLEDTEYRRAGLKRVVQDLQKKFGPLDG